MFKIATDFLVPGEEKKTIACCILKSAWDEIQAISVEHGISVSKVVGQMVYACLDRDKTTGCLKEKI